MPKQPTGFVIYRGPSMIDGAPIVAIAILHSDNVKTGDMVQVYFLRADMAPMDAARIGADKSMCGGCGHRGKVVTLDDGSQKNVGRTCYVTLFQGPRMVYNAFVAGLYPDISSDPAAIANIGADRFVRLGTYGDPASVPVSVLDSLLVRAHGHTGYTHQWRAPRLRAVTKYCQASCDSAKDVRDASALGLGIYYVLPTGAELPDGFLRCPAEKKDGKQCIDCLMCDGKGNRIAIDVHGSGSSAFNRRQLPTLEA